MIDLPVCHRLAASLANRWQRRRETVLMTTTPEEVAMPEPTDDGPVAQYLSAIESAGMAECQALAPDVLLDATVPNWRYCVRGDAAVRTELARWYAQPGTFEELDRRQLPSGELIGFTLRWEEAGVPHSVHQAHILEVSDGRITRDQVWCGGRWAASLMAEMAEASDASI